jgi:DNA ligase 1
MDFNKLSELYEQLEKTSSGNELRSILAEFFKTVKKEDIGMVAQLVLGKIAPDYESSVLGFAEKSVLKAISKASAKSRTEVTQMFKIKGDAGLVAQEVFKKKPITLIPVGKLTVKDLYQTLHKIVKITGSGTQEIKTNHLVNLYQKCSSGLCAKYLTRIVLGTMRLGVADMTVLDALAIAFASGKQDKAILEHAFNVDPDVGHIAKVVAINGLDAVKKISATVGKPIRMMAAQRVSHISEIQAKISGEIAVEAKYDGERVQIHRNGNEVNLFSRRLEDISYQFPDIVEYIIKETHSKQFIIEAEIMPFSKDGKHLGFHKLMQRKRKTDIEEYVKKIPVKLYCFELIFLNDKSYLKETYPVRVEELKKLIKGSDHLKLTERIFTNDVTEIEKFFNSMIDQGYEGLIAKSQGDDSQYKAGARAWQWIKWKKDYQQDMVDTFDLVIIGAFYGKGKRSGTYGSLLCATYNEKRDEFESVTKVGTGLTDEMLQNLPKLLDVHKVKKRPARVVVKKEMQPDAWFEPVIVVEVLAAEISRGPMHTCSSRDGKGLALRFPRFLRIRDDKTAEQATTSSEVEDLI